MTLEPQVWPAYRFLAGAVCRQDEEGGHWTILDKTEANALLSFCQGIRVERRDDETVYRFTVRP